MSLKGMFAMSGGAETSIKSRRNVFSDCLFENPIRKYKTSLLLMSQARRLAYVHNLVNINVKLNVE